MGTDEPHEVQQGQVQGPAHESGQPPVSTQDEWIDNGPVERIWV